MPDDFLGYVQKFENEAGLRGKILDIEKQGLKIEFADFTGKDYVGLCNYENPIRVEVDLSYWNNASDTTRELVLFHELAHGFLGIHDHRNDTLPNGDWKSIMRGAPAIVKSHKLEYGTHRNYYLDEIFLDNIKDPSWAYRPSVIECISKDNDFGLLQVTSEKSKFLTIKNKGNKAVFVNSIKASDCFYSNFTGSIQPNDSIDIKVSFIPAEQKKYSGVIQIDHTILYDTEIQPLTIEVHGEGSTSFAIGEWKEITPFQGAARYQASAFSVNGSGFVCLGIAYSSNTVNEIWENNQSNLWVKKNNFPGASRNYPIGMSINGKGYLGLGSKKNDFWEYDYSADTWTKKSDFPGPARVLSVNASATGKGYVGLGYDGSSLFTDFWEYDPVVDTWTQLPDYPGKGKIYAAAFVVNGNLYVGTGADAEIADGHSGSDFWEFDTSTKHWSQKSDFPGGNTNSAISLSINNYGYIGGGSQEGGNGTDNPFWEYNPLNDKWSKKAYMPRFSSGGAFFSRDNRGYFGIGYMTSPFFWEFNPNK